MCLCLVKENEPSERCWPLPGSETENHVTDFMPLALDTSHPFRGQSKVGKTFGRLTVKRFAGVRRQPNGNPVSYWECECVDGNIIVVSGGALESGNTKSCGCLQKELAAKRITTHGGCGHRLYGVWHNILQRCNNPKSTLFEYYGGRGIKVSVSWEDFWEFVKDMDGTYRPGLTIERLDVNGDYCKSNCSWITMKEQAFNRRNNRFYTLNGKTMTITDWCRHLGGNSALVFQRLKRGWDIERALSTPA